jgi:hypothetical protein
LLEARRVLADGRGAFWPVRAEISSGELLLSGNKGGSGGFMAMDAGGLFSCGGNEREELLVSGGDGLLFKQYVLAILQEKDRGQVLVTFLYYSARSRKKR